MVFIFAVDAKKEFSLFLSHHVGKILGLLGKFHTQ
jgi:hypothetical protein